MGQSPFLLNATLRLQISRFKGEYPEFVEKMIESFYIDGLIDNLVTGEDNS